jgi:hypothetical protein
MSQENLKLVRAHIEAYLHDAPRALSFFDPYIVIDWSRGPELDFEVAYGHEAVAQAVARFVGAFDDMPMKSSASPTSAPARSLPL